QIDQSGTDAFEGPHNSHVTTTIDAGFRHSAPYAFSVEFPARFTEFCRISVFFIPTINVLYCGAQVGVGSPSRPITLGIPVTGLAGSPVCWRDSAELVIVLAQRLTFMWPGSLD